MGIAGFDDLIKGGLPKERTILTESTGLGKTAFGKQCLTKDMDHLLTLIIGRMWILPCP